MNEKTEGESKQLKFRLQGDLLQGWENIRWREMNRRKNSRVEQALIEMAIAEFVSKYGKRDVPQSPDTYTEELHAAEVSAPGQAPPTDYPAANLRKAVRNVAAIFEEFAAAFRKIQHEIGPSSGDDTTINQDPGTVTSVPGVGSEDITEVRRAVKRALGDPAGSEQDPVPPRVRGVHGPPRKGKPKDRGNPGGGGSAPGASSQREEEEEDRLLLDPAERMVRR